MTDRVKGFIVTLGEDIRADDAAAIVQALGLVKGVIDVSPVVTVPADAMNRARVRHELAQKLWAVLEEG